MHPGGLARFGFITDLLSKPIRLGYVNGITLTLTDVDVTAADALTALDDDLEKAGIQLCFAEMKDPVKDRLKRYNLYDKIGNPGLT